MYTPAEINNIHAKGKAIFMSRAEVPITADAEGGSGGQNSTVNTMGAY